jgi:acyl-[acyl-carrier-protein]-phospholipid O-acyltransferase/long-chain-fatty-acid--[acyl-carrier-protein] ligase
MDRKARPRRGATNVLEFRSRAGFDVTAGRRTLFEALIQAMRRHGGKTPIIEDQDRRPLSYLDLVRAAFALGRRIEKLTQKGENVGVLLPTSMGVAVTFFALHAIGRIPVMLNFSAGSRNVRAACTAAGVKRVLSSKRFIAQGRLDDLMDDVKSVAEVTWLEDVREQIGTTDRLYAAVAGAMPLRFAAPAKPDDIGVILFTSGSFGAPKGVALTHANLLSNVAQIAAHIPLDPAWIWFNPLPAFHSFGLTGGILLPLIEGLRAFQYPSPLHYKVIPGLVRETRASVLLSTDTFVNQYARSSQADDLSALEFVVCGAERVRPETHELVRDRFDVMLVEGYGVTEASPVVAVNKPEDNRPGTVGQLLPGLDARLEPVEGIKGGGRLLLRGPNVMAGYLKPEGGVEAPEGGWYDTGDVVSIDEDGWVRILGRARRFAKIGGEMVSLAVVEELATALWPESRNAVVALSDPKKGERLVLMSDRQDAEPAALLAHFKAVGAPELAAPRRIIRVNELPVLGSGKTDYVAIQRMAEADAEADDPGGRRRGRG